MSKVAVIGLDCAVPALVFDRWKDELPNLRALMDEGVYGPLLSTHPPITVPAWTSMTASRDPGQLGIYGFRSRKDFSYDRYAIASSSDVTAPRLWDILSRAGKRVIVHGVPQTYPPTPVNGSMVSCFLTPSTRSPYTYPPALKAEIERAAPGYVVDVEDFRTEDRHSLLERIHDKTRKHFAAARHLLDTKPWDFFMMVEMGVDRIQHAFWKYMDPAHPRYEAGNPFEGAIRDYYRLCDREIATLLERFPADTAVLVVSDHGARAMEGGVFFNEWLARQGYLAFRTPPRPGTPITEAPIDWGRTRAWGEGGYYGRLFLNVRGREPDGAVSAQDYERVRDALVAEIRAIEGPDGRPLGCTAYRPEELYRAVTGCPPDLLVYFGDLRWRSLGTVGGGELYGRENDTGPDGANHDWPGLFIMRAPDGAGSGSPGPRAGLRIYDVAPTVLDLFGLAPAPDMVGSVIAR